jgi:hypothetical protein
MRELVAQDCIVSKVSFLLKITPMRTHKEHWTRLIHRDIPTVYKTLETVVMSGKIPRPEAQICETK